MAHNLKGEITMKQIICNNCNKTICQDNIDTYSHHVHLEGDNYLYYSLHTNDFYIGEYHPIGSDTCNKCYKSSKNQISNNYQNALQELNNIMLDEGLLNQEEK
tara:strand:+ start:976 stop:1284 length:309 start_codon:yes stop_codon:yes gene_type:complete